MNNTSKYSLGSSFSSFVEDVFNEKYMFDTRVKHVCREASLDHFCKHLFFVTVQIKHDMRKIVGEKAPVRTKAIFDAYATWHSSVSRKLLGPKYNKLALVQPFSMAFLDAEESCNNNTVARVSQIEQIHGLLLVHPDTRSDFDRLIKNDVLKQVNDNRVTGVDIIRFNPQLGSAPPLMIYESKYPCQTLREARINTTFWSFPDLGAKVYPFYSKCPAVSRR